MMQRNCISYMHDCITYVVSDSVILCVRHELIMSLSLKMKIKCKDRKDISKKRKKHFGEAARSIGSLKVSH